jgi:hypothetical protein
MVRQPGKQKKDSATGSEILLVCGSRRIPSTSKPGIFRVIVAYWQFVGGLLLTFQRVPDGREAFLEI